MKKLFFLLAAAVTLTACNSNDPKDPKEEKKAAFAKATYFEVLGTNTVPNVDGESKDQPFVQNNVRTEAVIISDSTLNINLYGVTFSSKMPVTIDMTIPGVSYTRSVEKITLSGQNLIPTMGGNPVARYVVNDLSGTITIDSLVLTNSYGPYTGCTYAGKITKMEEK